jgi:pimeloyl-ACP methyl ester carboxylesterase
MLRVVFRVAFAVLALAGTAAAPGHAQSRFYDAGTAKITAGPPGSLIRWQWISGAPERARAYRILYRSTGLRGEPIALSGVVIVPAGAPPPGGRPIIAWAHPTTGVVSRCAPSLALVLFSSIQGLRTMLAHGDIVAATDYPGLGTPGPHPYLIGVSEGRAVLDSVRAARLVPGADAGTAFAVWGHSQGGQAALFAGMLAPRYAPELHLVGVAAAAPATELTTLMNDDLDTPGGRNLTAMALWSWHRVFDAPITDIVVPAAVPVIDRLANECIERFFDIVIRRGPTQALSRHFLRVEKLSQREPWRRLLTENTPGPMPARTPVFIAQGTADRIVLPTVTRDYVAELCRAGSDVTFVEMPGVGHAFAGRDSAAAAVAWMQDRFAGRPAPDDCDRHP